MSFKIETGAVTIIGGGPAGAATAIALRELKIPCIVIDCQQEDVFKPGESLAPNVNPLLKQLRIDTTMLTGNHHAWHGNAVVWGRNKIEWRYFIKESFGNGWHLDRIFFEKQLREIAESRGVTWIEKCRFSHVEKNAGKLMVTVTNRNGSYMDFETSFLVDCSGRKSCVANKMKVRRRTMDNLTAYCITADATENALRGVSFIEAVRDGWWYAAPLKNKKVILSFMSDADLHKVQPANMVQWYTEKIKETKHLGEQAGICADFHHGNIQVRTATTSFIEKPAGKNWLALGDAMCSFDPLTSFGITRSLSDSVIAAIAIKEAIQGNYRRLIFFIGQQQFRFNRTTAMLFHQYQLEQRWTGEAFWKRRHASATAP